MAALPEDLRKLVLQRVPLKSRLGSCSLVCTTFAAAAVAVTDGLSISLHAEKDRTGTLMRWLDRHGQHVTRLDLEAASSVTRLPGRLPALKELQLRKCSLQLGAVGSEPGVLQGCCTNLTQLVLWLCDLIDWEDGLRGLSHLAYLQCLRIDQCHGLVPDDHPKVELVIPGSVLPSLTHLTCLDLESVESVADLHHLSCLSKLCELELWLSKPFSLTPSIGPGGFSLPASLRGLGLSSDTEDTMLDVSLLRNLTGLQMLHVFDVTFTAESGGFSGTALLGVLPALQQLKHLSLFHVWADWPAACPAYSALIPTTTLTTIEINDHSLPIGAYSHIFAAGRVLPQMRRLIILRVTEAQGWGYDTVVNVARCCPGLQALDCNLHAGVSVAPLGQLSDLIDLHLCQRGDVGDIKACLQAVAAALTNLQRLELDWMGDGRVGLDAFVPLTALRQLTKLDCWQRREHGPPEQTIWIICQATPGAAPDVWLQLLEKLGRHSSCQPLLTRSLGLQLAQQEMQGTKQQQQITELRQQGAAASAEAAELRGQLQTLQAQVQQLRQCCGGCG